MESLQYSKAHSLGATVLVSGGVDSRASGLLFASRQIPTALVNCVLCSMRLMSCIQTELACGFRIQNLSVSAMACANRFVRLVVLASERDADVGWRPPCVVCNTYVKSALFASVLVSGHYSRIARHKDCYYDAVDSNKSQLYFVGPGFVWPLGLLLKPDVKRISFGYASSFNESFGLCYKKRMQTGVQAFANGFFGCAQRFWFSGSKRVRLLAAKPWSHTLYLRSSSCVQAQRLRLAKASKSGVLALRTSSQSGQRVQLMLASSRNQQLSSNHFVTAYSFSTFCKCVLFNSG